MTVYLSGALPSNDRNGLAPFEKMLVEKLRGGTLVLGELRLVGRKEKEPDFTPEPVVAFSRIEIVPDHLRERVVDLINRAQDERDGGGLFEFGPSELEATTDYVVLLSEAVDDRFSFEIRTATDAQCVSRSGLDVATYGYWDEGVYKFDDIPEGLALGSLIRRTLNDFLQILDDSVVDAEVVDDDSEN